MIIHGRTVESRHDGIAAFGNARIRLTGIWKNLARLAERQPDMPSVIFVRPPLNIGQPGGIVCSSVTLRPASGAATTLVQRVVSGDKRIALADVANLQKGDVIRLDSVDPNREEVTAIESVDLSMPTVVLTRPLTFAHRAGTRVEKCEVDGSAAKTTLMLRASRGESTLFLRDLQPVQSCNYFRIGDEIHRVDGYETTSDADGFYQLPPLQRVGQVQLEASAQGRKVVVKFQPDFAMPRNQVDFVFKQPPTPDSAEDNHA
jgi:hypothetical protein